MKKGFTLVELLAVIVILAIISIITIPMVGNIIEDSKKKSLETSAYGIVESARYFLVSSNVGKKVYKFEFTDTEDGIDKTTGKKLNYKGNVDANGTVYVDEEGNISLCLMDDKYYVYKNYNDNVYIGNIEDNTCIVDYDPLTNKYVASLDDGSGSVSDVYSKDIVDGYVDSIQKRIDTNTANINKLTTDLQNNENDIQILNTNENVNSSKIDEINSSITNIQNDLSGYLSKSDLENANSSVETLATAAEGNKTELSNIQTTVDSLKYINCVTLWKGTISAWDGANYIEIDLTDSMMDAIRNHYHIIEMAFGSGTQTIGASGQMRVIGYYSNSLWNSGMPIIDSARAMWKTDIDNKKMYVWRIGDVSKALREISLCRNL